MFSARVKPTLIWLDGHTHNTTGNVKWNIDWNSIQSFTLGLCTKKNKLLENNKKFFFSIKNFKQIISLFRLLYIRMPWLQLIVKLLWDVFKHELYKVTKVATSCVLCNLLSILEEDQCRISFNLKEKQDLKKKNNLPLYLPVSTMLVWI